jgi:hypothetical protein
LEKRALGFDTSQLATLERVNVENEGYLSSLQIGVGFGGSIIRQGVATLGCILFHHCPTLFFSRIINRDNKHYKLTLTTMKKISHIRGSD